VARNPYTDWCRTSIDMWRLGFESSAVIALRSAKIAQGGTVAMAEANRMVIEKIEAAVEAQIKLMTGAFGGPGTAPTRLIRHYSNRVSANRRRLGR